jgi:hypothetical protein
LTETAYAGELKFIMEARRKGAINLFFKCRYCAPDGLEVCAPDGLDSGYFYISNLRY